MNKRFTGERLETSIENESVVFEHLHRYAIACTLSANKDVLDIASGEGYGSALIAKVAKKVVGVDISESAIGAAKRKYNSNNLSFLQGSASKIPLVSQSIDLVVSFETLEHHDQHQEMFKEIGRVLRPNGILIMSTPDKKVYSDLSNFKNSFHVKELYYDEFKNLVSEFFQNAQFYFQRMVTASIVVNEESTLGLSSFQGNYNEIVEEKILFGRYIICIASNIDLPTVCNSIFYEDFHLTQNRAVNNVYKSVRFKVGNTLISPFIFLKRYFSFLL